MKRMIFSSIVFAFLISNLSFAATKESCEREFKEWQNQYASSSLLRAIQKNWSKLDPAFSSYDEFKKDTLNYYSSRSGQVLLSMLAQYKEVKDKHQPQSSPERDRRMLNHIQTEIESSSDSELVFLYAGTLHWMEYFLKSGQSSQVKYSPLVLTEDTPVYSAKYRELMETIARFSNNADFKNDSEVTKSRLEISKIVTLVGLEKYLSSNSVRDLEEKRRIIEKLFDEQENSEIGNVIAVSDIHNMDGSEIFKRLPTPECLQLMGFKKVKLATEGLASQGLDKTNIKKLKDLASLKATQPFSAKQLVFLKSQFPYLGEAFEAGEISVFPVLLSLANYLDSVQKAGISVEYTGIDTAEGDFRNAKCVRSPSLTRSLCTLGAVVLTPFCAGAFVSYYFGLGCW